MEGLNFLCLGDNCPSRRLWKQVFNVSRSYRQKCTFSHACDWLDLVGIDSYSSFLCFLGFFFLWTLFFSQTNLELHLELAQRFWDESALKWVRVSDIRCHGPRLDGGSSRGFEQGDWGYDEMVVCQKDRETFHCIRTGKRWLRPRGNSAANIKNTKLC